MILRLPIVLRFTAIVAVGFMLPFIIPQPTMTGGGEHVVHILLIFSFLVGFLINRALERTNCISTSSANELSRLRRIYHLAEEISNPSWKKQTFKLIDDYQKAVSKGFLEPGASTTTFEKLTHHIYSFTPADTREDILFTDLLASTRDLALERQKRESATANKLSGYSWLVVGACALFLVILLLVNRTANGYTLFAIGATITGLLLILDLLYRLNTLSKTEVIDYQTRYAKNIPHQEKKRR